MNTKKQSPDSAYGEDGLTDSQRKLRQSPLMTGQKFVIDPAKFQAFLAKQREQELLQGKNSPKMVWPEE